MSKVAHHRPGNDNTWGDSNRMGTSSSSGTRPWCNREQQRNDWGIVAGRGYSSNGDVGGPWRVDDDEQGVGKGFLGRHERGLLMIFLSFGIGLFIGHK